MVTYNFPSQYRGNTFVQRSITLQDGNQNAINLTGATILMEFRYATKTGQLQKRLTVGEGITLSNPTGGVFTIDSFLLDFPVGINYYDCVITLNNVILTHFEGSINILQNTSQP